MPDYARLAATATRLITAAGVPITLTKASVDDYDPSTGTADSTPTKAIAGAAVRDGADTQYAYQQRAEDGDQVLMERVKLYVSVSVAPRVNDTLAMDSRVWKVLGVTPIAPGPVTLLYEVSAQAPAL